MKHKQKQLLLLLSRKYIVILIFLSIIPLYAVSQCLSSANPVGGTANLLVLEKKTFRTLLFHKYGQGTQYYENNNPSVFNLISKAYYNYLFAGFGYGLTNRFTIELETGYYLNKTQVYNLTPSYKLTGKGFSNVIISGKYNLFYNSQKRIYFSVSPGIKIPCSRKLKIYNNVELPIEVQPTVGAYGYVLNLSFVKENSGKGMRYFATNRIEISNPNKNEYKLGTAIFTSIYISKHLMFSWVKRDWTAILQIRNEIRIPDKITGIQKESSGSNLFFLVPQINHVINEKWYLSSMIDIPVYQYFKGTQLAAGIGITTSLSRVINTK